MHVRVRPLCDDETMAVRSLCRETSRCWSNIFERVYGFLPTFLLMVGIVTFFAVVGAVHAAESPPSVQKPQAPQILGKDIRSEEEKSAYEGKLGDPLLGIEEKKVDGKSPAKPEEAPSGIQPSPKPKVREPVKPKVFEKGLHELPPAEPYKPGGPVRVIPDLREDKTKQ